jgi:hypothetical protein
VNNTNNFTARESYLQARQVFFNAMRDKFRSDAECWNFVNSLKMTQSEIRLEVALNTTGSIFTFGVTPNQNNTTNVQYNTEQRLNLQDSLVCYDYGIFLARPSSNSDTTFSLETYANTQTFAAGDIDAINGTFYSNGAFEVRCNNDVIMPYRGLYNHLYKPETQQTDALGSASPQSQIRGSEDGFVTMEPNLILIGSKNYQPQIILPSAMASATDLRAVLILRGVLAQNSTIVN